MGAKLLFRDATGRDTSVDVTPDGVYIGRAADCAVRTDDAMVSRKNCKIAFAGRWIVEDLGSSNGTFVNEQRIQKQGLNHGDVIRCGTLQVRFAETADAAAPSPLPRGSTSPNVQIDPSLVAAPSTVGSAGAGGAELQQRLMAAQQEIEAARAAREVERQELNKLRAEMTQLREVAQQAARGKGQLEEELTAQSRVTEELRDELDTLRDSHLKLKARADEMVEELSAKDRQLERAQDDVQRSKGSAEELRNKLNELQRTKDEGWRELNNRVAEIENLRDVINEQERILEERRVGLINLEASVKDMRAERDRMLRDIGAIKSERDELRDKVVKLQANIEALEDEQRRLARAMAGGGSGGVGMSEEQARMSQELRELKVELRKAEGDRTRLTEQVQRLESERKELDEKMAKIEVERASLQEGRAGADVGRRRAEETLAKAEAARQRAEEEIQKAHQERDRALATADELRGKVSRLEREVNEARAAGIDGNTSPDGAPAAADAAARAEAEKRVADVEAKLKALEAQLTVARTEAAAQREAAQKATAAAASAAAAGNGHASGGAGLDELKKRAEDAYTGINDALSELRTSILLARDLAASHAQQELNDAIEATMARAEDAKGLLRSLREVVEA